MKRNVLISTDGLAKVLSDSARSELDSKLKEIKRLQAECEDIENFLRQIEGNQMILPITIHDSSNGLVIPNYKPNYSWVDKITIIIEHMGRALTTSEIAELMLKLDNKGPEDRQKLVGSISAILSAKSKGDNVLFNKSQNSKGENTFTIKN